MGSEVTLRLSDAMAEEIRRHGELAYPAECCGVLAGRAGETKEVVRLVAMNNRRTDDPHRYLIAPDDLRRTISELRGSELEVLGYYHSHPDHPAVPSEYDREHGLPFFHYVIVAVGPESSGEIASYVLSEDRGVFEREELAVRE